MAVKFRHYEQWSRLPSSLLKRPARQGMAGHAYVGARGSIRNSFGRYRKWRETREGVWERGIIKEDCDALKDEQSWREIVKA